MRLVINDGKFIVFLNKYNKIDFENKLKLEKYFRNLFTTIKDKYNIEVNGYYDINIYNEKNYGVIIEIESEDLEYYNYFNQIDMEINVLKDSLFLYEINYEFIDNSILDNFICYKMQDRIYLKAKDIVPENVLSKVLECSHILYGSKVEKIMKQGKKVKI